MFFKTSFRFLLWTEDSSNVKREVTLKLRFESARSAALVNGI